MLNQCIEHLDFTQLWNHNEVNIPVDVCFKYNDMLYRLNLYTFYSNCNSIYSYYCI